MRIAQWLILGGVALGLSACSTIKSWFPDKQKEYRYSAEIPALEIPPDVLGKKFDPNAPAAAAPTTPAATPAPAKRNVVNAAERPSAPLLPMPGSSSSSAPAAPSARDAIDDSPIGKYKSAAAGAETSARLDKDSSGPHIAVEAPFANVWTFTEKALNRLHVEIKDKDRSKQVFYVLYSQNAAPYEDKGAWYDLTSVFRKSPPKQAEHEYQVRLENIGGVLTKLRIADTSAQPLSEGESQVLLKAIHSKLLTLSKPTAEESKEENLAPERAR